MFVTLGLILRPSHLAQILPEGIAISAFLIFFARPVSVILTLAWTKTSFREMLMTSWLGLRGAVPIILATFTLYSGVQEADLIFNLVFFVVLLSVLVQGTSLGMVARWLKVTLPGNAESVLSDESFTLLTDNSELTDFVIAEDSPLVGQSIMSLKLPSDSLIMLIHREGATIVPNGRTRIQPNDVFVILADQDGIDQLHTQMQSTKKNSR